MHYAKRNPRGIEEATSAGVYEEIQAAVKGAVIRLYNAPSTRSPFPPRARLWRRQSEGTAVHEVKEWMKMKQYRLNELIGQNFYNTLADSLKQEQKNKGYTDEWLKEAFYQLNHEWRDMLALAVAENNGEIQRRMEQYAAIKNTNFTHNLSERDLADLQFLQTLIKTRILNECHGQPYLVECVLGDYINTQVGARAIMFLANDGEVGKEVKPHYIRAAANAQSVAEKRFNEQKAEKLERIDGEVAPFYLNAIIGDAMLKQADERVNSDNAERAATHYFDGRNYKPKEQPALALGQNWRNE